jgi:4-hydroxy-3-polyprenylbenzoate decarboxylase
LPFDDLRQWIAALDRAGQLKRIQTEADPILEIAEITDRVSKQKSPQPGGPALLFQNVKGYPGSQLLINQFGSEARMKLAVGVNSYDEIAARIRMFMDMKSPQGFLDKLKMLPLLTEAGKFFPRTVPTGPCKEVIKREKFSLLDFPILQCWPKDAGRFITLPCVTTRDPKSGKRNLGMYRMQVYDERTAGMHWQRQKNAAEHQRERMRLAVEGKSAAVDIMARTSGGSILAETHRPSGKMEVAVAIGTDPAVTFSAIVPAPPEIEEYLIAGFLRAAPVDLVKCETVDLEVPASSEIVLEGHVHLDELRSEGPFGDHTGFYSLEDLYPVFHAPQRPHLCDDDRRQTAAGRRIHGQSGGAHLSAADEAHHP